MISAIDALCLERARLSADEVNSVNMLQCAITDAVMSGMEYRGIDIRINEIRPSVIAALNQSLKMSGWMPQWQMLAEKSAINGSQRAIGYVLHLAPSDEAYKAAYAAWGGMLDFMRKPSTQG